MKAASGTAVVVGAVAVSMSVYGAGVAAADPYAGQTYGDASSAISSYGQTPVIAGRVGSVLPTDQCIVTRSQKASGLGGANFTPVQNTVLLYLNCNQVLAGPGVPGNSAASPEGQQAKKDQEAYEWKSTTEDGAQWCAENQKAHPDWGAAAFNGCPGT
ncbi:MAG: hypothetical protein KDB72_19350 [Mycobacterium sp.]|nr:hypothetical protein [Mycobacterium sp.]